VITRPLRSSLIKPPGVQRMAYRIPKPLSQAPDRLPPVCMTAAMLVLEPIFKADLPPGEMPRD
jgi:hypothetical protein